MNKKAIIMQDRGFLTALIFYMVTGLACLSTLTMDHRLIHMAILGIFSIASAFSLLKWKKLTLWFAMPLLLTATTFSSMILYYMAFSIVGVIAAGYMVLIWICTSYLIYKREQLK
ncbi:MAG: hypothetical protein QW612_01375 [Candidatus Bathyarchaeia archaeon]